MRPPSINILGKTYVVTYVANPADVDLHHRQSLWGQIDYWTRTIRIYDNKTPDADILQVLLHETLHGIVSELHMDDEKVGDEDTVDILALALADVLVRNDWLKRAAE
jgi:hypothetical protein